MATDQLTVSIEGGGPYGFRLFGGEEEPLVVAKLRRRSKASDAGLEEGDFLLSINDRSCHNISHAAAMKLVDGAGHRLDLRIRRKDGGSGGQLRLTREGSRQRSMTPHTGPYDPFELNSSRPSFQTSPSPSAQWSSRIDREIQLPPENQWKPESFKSGTEVQLQLHEVNGTSGGTGRVENTWTAKSSMSFSSGKDQNSIEYSKSSAQRRQLSSSPFNAKPASFQTSLAPDPAPLVKRAPVVWKPPSWQPSPEYSKPFATEERPRSAQSVGHVEFKENVSPQVNRNIKTTSSLSSAEGRKPAVWQPSVTPLANKSTNSFAIRRSPSPMADVDLEMDTRDLWQTKIENEKKFDLPTNLNKILAPSKANDYDMLIHEKDKKKVFVDSSFYDDPSHRYPTVEEQIRMARDVALSLTAPSNVSARGHRMFMKRKEKSDKWVVDSSKLDLRVRGSDTEPEPYYNPTPWNPTAETMWKAAPMRAGEIPAPPPLVNSRLFAPKLHPDDDFGERSKALSAEEFERLRLFSQKTTHNAIAPQVCFGIAEDLRQSKGKGGKMFAKRRAKADDWVIEGQSAPDPKLLQKISGGFAVPGSEMVKRPAPDNVNVDGPVGGDLLAPVNRLKGMVELPKAKMTPWDAVAEFGNVDVAFEHLQGISFVRPKVDAYAGQVANSLQQATQKKSGFNSASPLPTAPTPQRCSQAGPPQSNRSWNSSTAPSSNDWSQSQSSSSNLNTFDLSPPSFKGSGTGYRPISFQSASGMSGSSGRGGGGGGGGYSDL